MGSILDKASLVITPNAVKESKLYSVVPSDGSGDLTVTRATTATRVNGSGLIEETPYNLVSYSEQFDNAIWLKLNSSISANATTSPNGTLTADKLIENNITEVHQCFYNGISAGSRIIGNFVFTVYAKKLDSNRNISISASSLGNGRYCIIDLQNNAILSNNILTGTGGDIVSANVIENISLNDNWIRISVLFVTSGTNYLPSIGIANNNSFSYLGNGTSGIYIWGAQLVAGTSAKDYFKTTDRLNVPRLDYTNSTCPSILVEPQRTNLALYSEQFDNAYWTKTGSTISANAINSPNGTLTADRMVDNVSTGGHFVEKVISASSGANTLSVFCKKDNNRYIELCAAPAPLNSARFIFDFDTKTITSFGAIGTTITYVSSNITELQDGWFRLSLTFSIVSSTTIYYSFTLSDSPNVGTTNLVSYTGDGTKGVYIWGAQVEAGANATSYIPTTSASVTRNADTSNILLTGKNIMNDNNFTIYCEANWLNNLTNSGSIALSDTASAVGGSTRFGWFNGGSAILRNAGVGTSFIDATLGRTKLILKREGTELKWFKNGAQIWTTQIVPVTSYTYLVITNGGSTFTLNNLEIYKESFSDAECIALTTL